MANGLAEVRRGPGLKDRHFSPTAGIGKHKLNPTTRYAYDNFKRRPIAVQTDGTAASATANEINLLDSGLNVWEQSIIGTQTIMVPTLSTLGWDVKLDDGATGGDGAEYTLGVTALSPYAFTVGTDDGCFVRLKFKITDVSGWAEFAVGFHKAEASNDALDDLDELACLNVLAGDIKIETILNGAATTTTDTTDNWADGATHTLAVYVDKGGNVRYEIDGAAPTTTAAFKFDDAEVIVPFIFNVDGTDTPGETSLIEFECGLQEFDVRG